MKSEGTSTCQACGARVPVGLEFCPVCAFRGALEEGQETVELKIKPTPLLSFEHYQILTREDGTPLELGRGAMGVTYKAFDIDLRLPVTLKVISEKYAGDESARLRFLREARAAAKVRHTNVASVLHLGRTGSGYFYAMEFVEGETLESLMKRSGRLEVKLGLEIAAQVAAGLEAVQKQNLVHRDIKPSNIMVSFEEGGGVTTKIIDLGLARGVGEAAPESAISVPGGFAGTPEFASPEQFAGVGVDIRSDLYSLGVTLWVMLTGRPPFRGTPAELTYQHQHGVLPLEHLKNLPQEVAALIERLLDKDPKHRFQTPAELLKTLLTVTNELQKSADQKREVQKPQAQKSTVITEQSRPEPVYAEGLIEVSSDGLGFLRDPKRNYVRSQQDISVTPEVVRKHVLRDGLWIKGETRRGSRGSKLFRLTEINGEHPDRYRNLPAFEELTSLNPKSRIRLETVPDRYSTRVMDLMTPVGKGQRGLIVAPPHTGKTTLLQHIANGVVQNHPEVNLVILLIDERREEVTEMRRTVPQADIMASSNDNDFRGHTRIAQLAIERAKRLVEAGKDVFVLMDSLTRLGRAFNNAMSDGGRAMSHRMDARAMEFLRNLFAAARNTEEAGSLTIMATVLIETRSKMDELIFQEFKGTGNMEIVLDRHISDQRVYPAIDVFKSGTRREELLIPANELEKINTIRRGLAGRPPVEAIERLLSCLRKFPTNTQMLRGTGSGRAKPQKRSVAVLPFESLSTSKKDTYFADGVQDEILSNLAKISQLKVISRSSVMTYRSGANRNLRAIANELGVARVIEGTVRRSGNRVRIATRLVDAQTGEALWSESYDRSLSDIFAIQSEIAQTVASRLSARLLPEEEKSIVEKPTDNLEAYDLYLQAKQLVEANYWRLRSSEKEIYLKIISLLEQATQKDSKFALAYCLLAKAHDTLYVDDIDPTPERRALGDASVNEALRVRPGLPEAHLAMAAHLYYCYRDFERARVQIAIAAKALSNNSYLLELTALIDRVQGRWEESVTGLERAVILDPRNRETLVNLALTYGWLRRYRDSDGVWNRLIELDPKHPSFRLSKADSAFAETADLGVRAVHEALPPSMKGDPAVAYYRVYYSICARDFATAKEILSESPNKEIYFLGAPVGVLVPRQIFSLWDDFLQGNHPTIEEFGAAREQLVRKLEADPTNPSLVMAMAYADLSLGRKEESIQEAQRAMKMRPISEDAVEGPAIASDAAEIYALAGRPEDAFEQLKMLINMPAPGVNYGELKTYPGWDPLRKDPRFEKLLAQLAPNQSLQEMPSGDPLDIKHEKLLETVIQPPTPRREKLPVVRVPERSIAVLPFDNLSEDKGDTYFADGVQDEILSNLAKLSQLKVISRTSVMTYRPGADRDLRSIARILRVTNVVEGTVRKDGNRTRITVRLVDARADVTIWSETYDRDLSDIFTIQGEIAQMVACKLAATISPLEKERIEAKPTHNLQAYDRYMRAKQLIAYAAVTALFGYYENQLIDAIALLEEAIRLDSNFTLAYCASAEANSSLCFRYGWTSARRASADQAVKQALRLQPELPEVHLAYARHLYGVDRDYEKAKGELAIAKRGLPNDVRVIISTAWIDRRQGRWEEAIRGFREAISLDPRNVAPLVYLGSTLANLCRFSETEEIYDRAIDLEPDNLMLKAQKALWLTRKTGNIGPLSSVIAALPRLTAEDPGILSWRLVCALINRAWQQATELITRMNGSDVLNFSYVSVPVPVDCYLILLSRIQGGRPSENSDFTQIRENLSQKVQASAESAGALSNLAVVDALLGEKHIAIREAKRSVEMLVALQDVAGSPAARKNLAVVYAWSDELDLAFETLGSLTKVPSGLYYGDVKLDLYWDPLRKDPRFAELLAELAPDD